METCTVTSVALYDNIFRWALDGARPVINFHLEITVNKFLWRFLNKSINFDVNSSAPNSLQGFGIGQIFG